LSGIGYGDAGQLLSRHPPLREGACEIGFCLPLEKRIGEATHADESFLVGGFNLLWAFKFDLIEPRTSYA